MQRYQGVAVIAAEFISPDTLLFQGIDVTLRAKWVDMQVRWPIEGPLRNQAYMIDQVDFTHASHTSRMLKAPKSPPRRAFAYLRVRLW